MSARPGLPAGPFLVVGLARSGVAAARVLAGHGEVIGCDRGHPEVALPGVEVHLDSSGVELLERVATLVKSPGVPRDAPVVTEALRRGVEVTGELELAWRLLPNRFLAVTGTNGKTTTVELLGAIYRAAGIAAAVAGNVGTPLASLVGRLDPAATVVCECSSFQLEDSSAFAPECAVLLNLEPDHLDRHGDLERYRQAKLRAFVNQGADAVAVVPAGMDVPGAARRASFGEQGSSAGGGDRIVAELGSQLALRGAHNADNARAAATAALACGVPEHAVREALRSFRGVAHRLEEVGKAGGVLYVNDSKATNVAAALRGIEAFDGGVHAILGGSLKGGDFSGLRPAVSGRCRAAYLIGQAQERLAGDLEGAAPLRRCETLERAVGEAAAHAREGEVVLLSPACASFDAFRDYEQRGEAFRALVARLAAVAG